MCIWCSIYHHQYWINIHSIINHRRSHPIYCISLLRGLSLFLFLFVSFWWWKIKFNLDAGWERKKNESVPAYEQLIRDWNMIDLVRTLISIELIFWAAKSVRHSMRLDWATYLLCFWSLGRPWVLKEWKGKEKTELIMQCAQRIDVWMRCWCFLFDTRILLWLRIFSAAVFGLRDDETMFSMLSRNLTQFVAAFEANCPVRRGGDMMPFPSVAYANTHSHSHMANLHSSNTISEPGSHLCKHTTFF